MHGSVGNGLAMASPPSSAVSASKPAANQILILLVIGAAYLTRHNDRQLNPLDTVEYDHAKLAMHFPLRRLPATSLQQRDAGEHFTFSGSYN